MSNYLSNNIKFLRNLNRLTQKEVGDYIGVESGVISSYERGKSIPPIGKAAKMANYFNVTLDDIVNSDLQKKHIGGQDFKKSIVEEPTAKYGDKDERIRELEKENSKLKKALKELIDV